MPPPLTCTRPGCGNGHYLRGMCVTHYGKRAEAGMTRRVPIETVARHLRALRAEGWALREITAASGVTRITVETIAGCGKRSPRQKTVWRSTASAILAVPLDGDHEGRGRVSAVGTKRRIKALARMGWSMRWQADQFGVYPNTLRMIVNRDKQVITDRIRRGVAELYDAYAMQTGPCRVTATQARKKGWPSPLAWDDDAIDDPDARPTEYVPRERKK